ncbi:MAG: helix-turn-helix transcriptional regulator [Reichenbachiella sp.]
MKQPLLGQVITKLRQEKQLTQEEVVEQCNISVRTLQRIEAGDVTPRDFTIKSLLGVLDYDLREIESNLSKKTSLSRLNKGWIAGIIYFAMGIFEALADGYRFEYELPFYFPLIYTAIKIVSISTFIIFMLGFAEVGKLNTNFLLKITAYLMIAAMTVMIFYDVISIFSDLSEEEFMAIKAVEGFVFGGIDLVFGVVLLRLARQIGSVATVGGLFQILAGVCFITVVFSIAGLILLIPAVLFQVIILYKYFDLNQ